MIKHIFVVIGKINGDVLPVSGILLTFAVTLKNKQYQWQNE
jgi:hypothetical protein